MPGVRLTPSETKTNTKMICVAQRTVVESVLVAEMEHGGGFAHQLPSAKGQYSRIKMLNSRVLPLKPPAGPGARTEHH